MITLLTCLLSLDVGVFGSIGTTVSIVGTEPLIRNLSVLNWFVVAKRDASISFKALRLEVC